VQWRRSWLKAGKMERWCAEGLSGVGGTGGARRSLRGWAASCNMPLVGLVRRSLNF